MKICKKKVQPFRGGVCQTSAAGAACSDVIKEQQLQQTEKAKWLVLHHVFLAFHWNIITLDKLFPHLQNKSSVQYLH